MLLDINKMLQDPLFQIGVNTIGQKGGFTTAVRKGFQGGFDNLQRLQAMKQAEDRTAMQQRNVDLQQKKYEKLMQAQAAAQQRQAAWKQKVAGGGDPRQLLAQRALEAGDINAYNEAMEVPEERWELSTRDYGDGTKQRLRFNTRTGETVLEGNRYAEQKAPESNKELMSAANTLRDDFSRDTKTFEIMGHNYNMAMSAPKTGAGDAGRVFALMKLYDPTSVVREGEQATAQNAAGVPSWVKGKWNHLVGNGTLDEEARDQIDEAITSVYNTGKRKYNETFSLYSKRGQDMNIPQMWYMPESNRLAPPPEMPMMTGGGLSPQEMMAQAPNMPMAPQAPQQAPVAPPAPVRKGEDVSLYAIATRGFENGASIGDVISLVHDKGQQEEVMKAYNDFMTKKGTPPAFKPLSPAEKAELKALRAKKLEG